MTIINAKNDDLIRPLQDGRAQDAVSAWRTYEEQCRRVSEVVEPQMERPIEEGKGQFVDVFA